MTTETKTAYEQPGCEIITKVQQTVLCASTTGASFDNFNPSSPYEW